MDDEERGGSQHEYVSLPVEDRYTLTPIDISDPNHKVQLLDISSNKKWVASVTFLADDTPSKGDYFLTKRRFTAFDQEKEEEMCFSDNPASSTDLKHSSIRITDSYTVDTDKGFCRFLSISNNGRYVALSFYEEGYYDPEDLGRGSLDLNCLIFDMDLKSSEPYKIKGQGRAVFLNEEEKSPLAIISKFDLEIYAGFPEIRNVTCMMDLTPFHYPFFPFETLMIKKQRTYIKNTSWARIFNAKYDDSKTNDMEIIMTITKHIRLNLLITPYKGEDIVRIWSILGDGARLASFYVPEQQVMAISKNYKFVAVFAGWRSLKVYNVKSGSLMYHLKPSEKNKKSSYTVSHVRFCYNARYVVMASLEDDDKVTFEVWYLETERSIYTITKVIDPQEGSKAEIAGLRRVGPFVTRELKNNRKCLKGYYTSYPKGRMTVMCVELKIDETSNDTTLNWISDETNYPLDETNDPSQETNDPSEETNDPSEETNDPSEETNDPSEEDTDSSEENEMEDGLNDFKCGNIEVGDENYLIRFGRKTVQLWQVSKNKEGDLITNDDKLIYIRAFKGPDYGLDYSFRETWSIFDFETLKYIGGNHSGRFLVNIKLSSKDITYHTEELFLPLEKLLSTVSSSVSNGADESIVKADEAIVKTEEAIVKTEEAIVKTEEAIVKTADRKFDYHQLESACQALHYLFIDDNHDSNTISNLNKLREKTNEIIQSTISDIKDDCNFFVTFSGSRMIAMLASFEEGRTVIKSILATKVPISIFSYTSPRSELERRKSTTFFESIFKTAPVITEPAIDTRTVYNMPDTTKEGLFHRSSQRKLQHGNDRSCISIASNENILTVLIDQLKYDLYNLLFNRILLDSTGIGAGCFAALTDTLLYLEEGGKHNILLSSSAKLSYLKSDCNELGITEYEFLMAKLFKLKQKMNSPNSDHLEAYATEEQVKMYKGYSARYRHWNKIFIRPLYIGDIITYIGVFYKLIIMLYDFIARECYRDEVDRFEKLCLVPITHFYSYHDLYKNEPKYATLSKDEKSRRKDSASILISLDQRLSNMFQPGDIVLELLLNYKWRHFARSKFILICFIHAVYYISYCTGVLFAPELYGLNLEEDIFLEHPGQITSMVLMVISLLILAVQEARQFSRMRYKFNYFFSGYNWIDIGAFVLPLFTFIQLCKGWPYFIEVCSVSTLILWTHAILRLRVISHFGITLEIIIQLSKKIAPMLLIMLIVIFAFTQSYIVLLRLQPDEYFRDTFLGTFLSTNGSGTGDVTFEGNVEFATSSDNGFSNWFTAFYNVWLFIYGVWDPIVEGDAGSNLMVMGMSVLFSLIAVLIFFNMVIAIMSSVIEEVDSRGKKAWSGHFTDVVSEIENLWCFEKEYNLKNNPTCLFYLANKETILEHKEKLEEETAKLKEKLKIPEVSVDSLLK